MIKYIFSDFDGTLTLNGQMSAVFFDLLDHIKKHQQQLIIVSGRSLSWGHFLLTHFPVDHVIMEGGGVIVSRGNKDFEHHYMVDQATLDKLEALTIQLQMQIPQTVMSADSLGRLSDRAVEFKQMDKADLKSVEEFLEQNNLNFSYSNVHLNFWLGDISKFNACEHFMNTHKISKENAIFFGDAPNDQSMFLNFEHTVGVSNIKEFENVLKHKPKHILKGEENREILGVLNYLKQL